MRPAHFTVADISTIDEELVMTLRMYTRNLTQILSTVLVISGVSPIFTACLIPICFFYLKEQAFFTVSCGFACQVSAVLPTLTLT